MLNEILIKLARVLLFLYQYNSNKLLISTFNSCLILKNYKLLPLKLRFFKNFVFFVFSLIKYDRKSAILNSIKSLRKTRATRAFFDEPLSNTNLYKFSFISISIKLLNNFIYKYVSLEEKLFKSIFEATIIVLYNANFKHWS
jgi:hypothetical protein